MELTAIDHDERQLTLRGAARRGRRRRDRHRGRGDHRHAGAPAGQAVPRAVLPRRGARARHRGLQLPARRRRRHEHRRRLRDVVAGSAATATSRCVPDLGHAAPGALAAGHRDGAVPTWPGSTAPTSSASPRQILRRQLDAARRARADRVRRHRAGVRRCTTTPTRRPGGAATATSRRPTSYNVDYSLLGTARVEPLLRRHPQRDGRRRARRRRARRASATSASTRSPSATPTR